MKEFIDKLIGRLVELKIMHLDMADNKTGTLSEYDKCSHIHFAGCYSKSISIVEELAEEYKGKVMIDEQYCWQNCCATEHCKECRRLGNGTIDYFENYDCLVEEYKGGWIPCSERFPETEGEYLISLKSGEVTSASFILPGKIWVDTIENYFEYAVIAWCELPAPYTEGESR